MGLTRLAINLAVKNQKIESFDSYLFIGPHPDDIEIGAGATISKLSKMGKKITFLICTDGRYGKENLKEDISCEELIKIRHDECLKSAEYLGVSDVRFLNLSDGGQYSYEELVEGIAATINDVKPDIVFAPDPDVDSECHADHLNVGRATKLLANFANYSEIFEKYLPKNVEVAKDIYIKAIALFMTAKPNIYVRTNKNFKRQKESILFHTSQYPKDAGATSSLFLYLTLRAIEFGFKCFSFKAEGFRMMNQTRMHCLPEASK